MKQAINHRQQWLKTPAFDTLFILAPGFAALLVTVLLPERYKSTAQMPLAAWVILVLLVDVAHVYSTLYRTYWDPVRFSKHKVLYLTIPIACYIGGVLLYAINGLLFWRLLAYLAVFHFVRQQYGFMRLYSRNEPRNTLSSLTDTLVIYAATIYPLVYWHCTSGRNFNWFVANDFVAINASWLKLCAGIVYAGIIATYVVKELVTALRAKYFNIPKNAVIVGTLLTWYAGIIAYNGDLAFTLLNVIAHGIPYVALIWITSYDNKPSTRATANSLFLKIAAFVGALILLAYLEEGLWDGMVWREHNSVFPIFQALPVIDNPLWLCLIVPLLSLPQSTHYVLDGFIWRREGKN